MDNLRGVILRGRVRSTCQAAAPDETHPVRGCLKERLPHIPGDGCVIDSLVIKISALSRVLFPSNNFISLINIKLKVIIKVLKRTESSVIQSFVCNKDLYHNLV